MRINIQKGMYSIIFGFMAIIILLLPNLGLLFSLVFILFVGIKRIGLYYSFFCLVLFYTAFILATKTLTGEGNDYITYFYNIQDGTFPTWNESKFDFLFWYIGSLVQGCIGSNNNALFFWIVNLISLLPFLYLSIYLWNNTDNDFAVKVISMFFLVFIPSFSFWNLYGNYIRQAWSFTFTIGFMVAIIDRRYIFAIIFSFVALTSHSTGVIFMLCGCMTFMSVKINIQKLAFFALIFCGLFTVLPLFNYLFSFLPVALKSKLDFYSTWSGADFGKTAAIRLVVAFLYLYIVDCFLLKKEQKKLTIYNRLYLLFIIFMLMIASVSFITKVVERLYYPTFVIFFILASMQYFSFMRNLNPSSRVLLGVGTLSLGIPLLLYSFYSSLFYNPSFFNGDLTNFFLFNISVIL